MNTSMSEQSAGPRQEMPAMIGSSFSLRFAGMVLVGAALITIPNLSKAATTDEVVPSSQQSCLHSMSALIHDARGSATRIEVSKLSASSKEARIFVSDGEVRIVCDASSHQMKISRVLNASDDESAPDEVALVTPKFLVAKD